MNDAELFELLERTSRTFAVAVPLLPQPLARHVAIAYLLYRVADTLEDGEELERSSKLAAMARLADLLAQLAPSSDTAASPDDASPDAVSPSGNDWQADLASADPVWPAAQPPANPHYAALLDRLPELLQVTAELPLEVRRVILGSVRKSLDGMIHFVRCGTADGRVRINDLAELRDYCYYVAGLVGEMLTELFLLGHAGLEDWATGLRGASRWFGEGLQLVNIVKDSRQDEREGRQFIPPAVSRETVYALAEDDLQRAREYVNLLRAGSAPGGVIAFADLPLRLAWRTLDVVRQTGPGSKISRHEVAAILADVLAAADGSG